MIEKFKEKNPSLFENNKSIKIPLDLTIYYLRKKALTKKINKQELAWLLLNFNKKRGYYQLRGEDENEKDDKTKIFKILKVKEIKETGLTLKNTKDKLYDVFFENGWKYPEPIKNPKDWENKTKQFIITTSILKDNTIKRSYKKVDLEKDWIAIKKKTEQDIYDSGKEVGEFIYDKLLEDPTKKIRGNIIKTIERKFYKKELKAILKKQSCFHKELHDKQLSNECLRELYPKNKLHINNIKNKGFEYLIIEDVNFYQRPITKD